MTRHYLSKNDDRSTHDNEEHEMEPLKQHAEGARWFVIYLAGVCAIVAALAFCGEAKAQTQPMTFAASVTSADGELNTALTWEAPGASGCTAAGHPSWTGDKPASGTLTLPTITLSGSYSLTLACTWPGDQTASLSWTPATQNTDGSSYTNAKGFTIHYGETADGLAQSIGFFEPTGASYIVDNLYPATWYFCVKSVSALDVSSSCSNTASKTITGSESHSESIALTINPIPGAPSNLAVE